MFGACALKETGLGPSTGTDVAAPDGGGSGAGGLAGAGPIAGSGGGPSVGGAGAAGGDSGAAGAGGDPGLGGDKGAAGGSGMAGDNGAAGGDNGAAGGSGMAGDDGRGGQSGSGQAGAPGSPDGGMGGSGGMPISAVGCADGTREGLSSLTKFPDVAACSGGWTVPGLVAAETLSPQCGRGGGNDGAHPNGEGCSVADLCAEGWHVCESAHEFSTRAASCDNAFPGGMVKMFFATRQRGPMTTCDPANETGTNNVYGCGNFGSNAMAACAPFMHMLRDNDCKNNPPWSCVDGPINYSTSELLDVTKPGPEHGGVLCCR